jgi:ankyrin repeat protein
MKYLENKGFDIYFKNYNGYNAYLLATCGGHLEIMKYLEKIYNMNIINIKNKHGDNAYMCAAYHGYLKIIEFLETKGFNIHTKNKYGYTAYATAVLHKKNEIINYFDEKHKMKIS